jgi:plasmid maintenance system killer protein
MAGFAKQSRAPTEAREAATSLKDLAALPGNRLEGLKGDRQGQYSIRVNDQWRICFEWPGSTFKRFMSCVARARNRVTALKSCPGSPTAECATARLKSSLGCWLSSRGSR